MPSITVSASDVNGTIPMLSAVGMPTGITFTDNADGTGTIAGTTNDPVGTYTVTVTASDGALTDTDTIDIEVVSPNAAPTVDTFVPTGPVNVVQGEAITTITVTASDPDGTIPTLSATGLPTGITFVDNADGTGTISGSTTDPDGTYTVTVTASDGVLTGTGTIDIEVDPDALVVFARINAAGPLVAAIDGGPDWEADTAAANHPFLTNPGSNGNAGDTAVDPGPTVPAHVPGDVVDTERWSNSGFGYTVPVPNGTHVDVRLFVANQYGPTSTPGTRVFDVAYDGNIVADDFDIIPVFGNLTAGMLEYHITSDGAVNIDFSNVIENPLVNAIEVVEADPSPGELAASPTAIDFATVAVNSSGSDVVTLSNLGFDAGDPSIDVTSVTVAGGDFSASFAGPVTVASCVDNPRPHVQPDGRRHAVDHVDDRSHRHDSAPGRHARWRRHQLGAHGRLLHTRRPGRGHDRTSRCPRSWSRHPIPRPTPRLATGLPTGITFTDNADGTGTIDGTTSDPRRHVHRHGHGQRRRTDRHRHHRHRGGQADLRPHQRRRATGRCDRRWPGLGGGHEHQQPSVPHDRRQQRERRQRGGRPRPDDSGPRSGERRGERAMEQRRVRVHHPGADRDAGHRQAVPRQQLRADQRRLELGSTTSSGRRAGDRRGRSDLMPLFAVESLA